MRAMTSGENQPADDDTPGRMQERITPWAETGLTPAKPRKRRAWWLVGGLLAAALVMGLGSWAGYISDFTNPKRGAKIACQKFINDRLKAPSTAVYGEAKVKEVNDAYVVTGSVDAENSFSAMVRDDYSCTVDWTREDGWRLRDLKIG